jgi:hypothetical protein
MGVSWVDRIIRAVDRLPVAAWMVYTLGIGVMISAVHLVHWGCGTLPAGTLNIPIAVTAMWSILVIGTLDYSYRIGLHAFDAFRPILVAEEDKDAELVRTFTSIPALPALLAIPFGCAYLWLVTLFDSTFYGLVTGSFCSDTFLYFLGAINTIMILISCYQSWRVLAAVQRIQARVVQPDLFQGQPLFAFSRLTSYVAICIAGGSYLFYLAFPATMANPPSYGLMFLLALPLSLASFFLPLAGMHGRMVAEKGRLLNDVGQRIKSTRQAFHQRLDAMELASMDGMNKALASLMLEEEYIRKIRTWPWEPSTLSAVLTAIFLPISLFVVERLLLRLMDL